jgi:hypothetical protein
LYQGAASPLAEKCRSKPLLYQGTTLVVPKQLAKIIGLQPLR